MRYVLDVRVQDGRIRDATLLAADSPPSSDPCVWRLAAVSLDPLVAASLANHLDVDAADLLPHRWQPVPSGGYIIPGDLGPIPPEVLALAAHASPAPVQAGKRPRTPAPGKGV